GGGWGVGCSRPAPGRASGCRRWAGPRTTWSSSPTRTPTWPPTRRCRPGSARRGSGAWPCPWWSRSDRRATSWSPRSPSECACCGSARAPTSARRWAHLSLARTGIRLHPTWTAGGPRAPRWPWAGGCPPGFAAGPDGFWLGPSVLDHVTPQMSCYRDEIFGPVLSVVRAPSYDDALRLVSDNPYGNGVAIFTNDGGAARRFVSEVEVGMVGVNVPIPVPMAYYSFGGWKSSLFGDTPIYRTEGIHLYTPRQAVPPPLLDPRPRRGRPPLP